MRQPDPLKRWEELFELHPLLWEVSVGRYQPQDDDYDEELALTLVDANGHPFNGHKMPPAILSQFVDCICEAVNQHAELNRCLEYPRPWIPTWNPTHFPTYRFAIPKAANGELVNYRCPWGKLQNESTWMICDCINAMWRQI